MLFDPETGVLNPTNQRRVCFVVNGNWAPYYNIDGKFAGYRCGQCGTGYYHPTHGYVESYEDLDW